MVSWPFVLKDARIFYDGMELTTSSNEVAFDIFIPEIDVSKFTDSYKTKVAGLPDGEVIIRGWQDNADDGVDEVMFDELASDGVMQVYPDNTAGGIGYGAQVTVLDYKPFNARVGEVQPFEFDGKLYQGVVVRLNNMEGLVTKTASGNGTARQLGAVSAAQKLYGFLNVTSVSTGDTIDCIVQSDDNQAMTSPTTRLTFAQKNAIGAEYKTANGPITDTWWRIGWTLGGASISISFLVGVGIQ